jgi:hypothetical protein
MNLTYLTHTDRELLAINDQQNAVGKEARREIQRRKMVGYSDGTVVYNSDAEREEEVFTIIAKASKAPAARKVEKKMAGRGR